MAGQFGLRLLGCPGRRGQGSRPEAARLDPPSLRWKSAFSSLRQRPKLPAVLCARPGGVHVPGAVWYRPQNAAGRVTNPPGSSQFYFLHGFLAFADFSLKKWFPNLVAWLSLRGDAEPPGRLPWGAAGMDGGSVALRGSPTGGYGMQKGSEGFWGAGKR